VDADRVRETRRAIIAHSAGFRTGERSVRAGERKVAISGRLRDAVVVQKRAAVEELSIELATVDGSEGASEQPGPVRVANERLRQLCTRPLASRANCESGTSKVLRSTFTAPAGSRPSASFARPSTFCH